MDRMTAGQMLGRVDALLPNQYGREEKMQWLAQAEGFVLREACLLYTSPSPRDS